MMKMSKKIVLMSSLVATSLFGEVTTILPYYGQLDYATDNSIKDKGSITGAYMSYGNLNYLIDLDVAYTKINYKDPALFSDLKQTDITSTIAWYFPKYMFKLGLHNISTTDTDLGDGTTLISAVEGYKYYGYNKFTYGLEGYWTRYGSGHDENNVEKAINIYQATPYIGYSKAINLNTRNNVNLKMDYISVSDFNTKSYTSFTLSDTLYYKKFYTTASGYTGEMKVGVKDSGHSVYNLKDLMKSGYGLKVGYFLKKNLTLDVGYSKNTFQENGFTEDTSNQIFVTTLNYNF